MTYLPASTAFEAVKGSHARLELSCHPLEGFDDFGNQGRPGTAISRDLARLIDSGPESGASLADRDKWQLLARELA